MTTDFTFKFVINLPLSKKISYCSTGKTNELQTLYLGLRT